jgi:hypothetical protein
MKLTVIKTYDNPECASGYHGKFKVGIYHASTYSLSIGAVNLTSLNFKDGKLSSFNMDVNKTSEDGSSIYFEMIGKSLDETIRLITKWLEE